MTNKSDQFGTPEWREENNRRVFFQNHMYRCAGRDNPDHPMHGLFTGLWHDFCLNEAGKAQRDMWFERIEFIQKVQNGEIVLPQCSNDVVEEEIPRPEEEIAQDFNVSNADPVDAYLNCSAECDIDDQECEDICLDELKKPVIEEFDTSFNITQADSPHQAAIAK